ncbi:MAG: tyrosine-type recombinase/integrase [Desulfobacteraceae bacterium]|nr:tyrosine-type recombinase/integrase [Desulfobacteraceae bacterium]MBU4056109.1 tyrosine-type recombinase/integrase [Pseudomonadota bacterium]
MIAWIDLYRKELLKVNGFSPSTVETYVLSIQAFLIFAREELKMDVRRIKGPHLMQWMGYLKATGIGSSRMEGHHYALKSFFAFLQRAGEIKSNPAEALPLLIHRKRERTHCLSTPDAFRMLDSFDRISWQGLRNYTMVSLLWALGLRTAELTGLTVGKFEIGHGKRIGLLRIRGKNKKQRALFVVDRLFDTLVTYLTHPESPKKKLAPLFPAQPNKAISNNRLQRLVKDQAKAAGIVPEVTPRVLRHSFATEMYLQNVPLSAIQAMMGHESVAETSIYVHVSEKLKQLALDAIHLSGRLSWE